MSGASRQKYDIVILGAGMVGLSLACALQSMLAEKSCSILLLESKPVRTGPPGQPGFDVRSTVLSHATVQSMELLGLWEAMRGQAEAIKQIHVSDQGRFGTACIDAEEEALDALGYVLENPAIGRVLNQAVLGSTQIETLSPVTVTSIINKNNHAEISCRAEAGNFSVRASLVVVAEGGRSGLCEQLGIFRRTVDYKQTAVIANVGFSSPHHQVAYERFTPNGPLALLPLSDFEREYRAALIWTQKSGCHEEVLALNDEEFLQRLQEQFGHRLGTFTRVGERAAFPLSLQLAEEQVRHNLVLLGNVAHTLHPVAGQGFNLAFRDAMRLAENICASLDKGISPGNFNRLQAYVDATRNDQNRTVSFSHHLTSLFSSERELLVWFRKAGLLGIDLLPPLKKALSRQAMGMGDRMVRIDGRS